MYAHLCNSENRDYTAERLNTEAIKLIIAAWDGWKTSCESISALSIPLLPGHADVLTGSALLDPRLDVFATKVQASREAETTAANSL